MSMNDVNLAPGNNNQPIKDVKGESTQTLGGGTLAGTLIPYLSTPPPFLFLL